MKPILIALLALTVGVSGVFAAGPLGDEASTDRTIPLATNPASSSTTTETAEDVPGPCDEPEHRNDPRCAAATASTTTASTTTTTESTTTTTTTETRGRDKDDAREPGEDVRGPCDEAEHANDPRCTGAAPEGDDDRRGSNSGPGGGEDSGSGSSGRGGSDDDRSGSNSGSG
jgi:hypothetical protein